MTIQDVYQALVEYREEDVPGLVRAEIDAATDLNRLLNEGLIAAMDTVGDKFAKGQIFFPEMLLAAQAMKAGMAVLKPVLASSGAKPIGTIVTGTVKGDLHDIGKNLVASMLEGGGFTIVDLGFDVPPEAFVQAARENAADGIAMSALLTTTMPTMGKVVSMLQEQGLREKVRVMIGGAPVTQAFADSIGADGYGPDGPAAVELARRLLD